MLTNSISYLPEKPGISFKMKNFSASFNLRMTDTLETKSDICISTYIKGSQTWNF